MVKTGLVAGSGYLFAAGVHARKVVVHVEGEAVHQHPIELDAPAKRCFPFCNTVYTFPRKEPTGCLSKAQSNSWTWAGGCSVSAVSPSTINKRFDASHGCCAACPPDAVAKRVQARAESRDALRQRRSTPDDRSNTDSRLQRQPTTIAGIHRATCSSPTAASVAALRRTSTLGTTEMTMPETPLLAGRPISANHKLSYVVFIPEGAHQAGQCLKGGVCAAGIAEPPWRLRGGQAGAAHAHRTSRDARRI